MCSHSDTTGVSNPAPEGPLSSRVQLQPQLNTPDNQGNQGLTRHTRNFQAVC